MGLSSYFFELMPKVIGYKLSYWGIIKPPLPANFTISITNMCQSRCKTCNVWKLYEDDPELKNRELKLGEIEKIFRSIGHTYFFNISGGEPFLRKDFPEIIEAGCKYLTPKIIHTPTNGIAPELIERQMLKIMKIIQKYDKNIQFTIKPSFDAIGKKHDEIRGVKGNFNKVLDTLKRLKKIQKRYPNLHIGLGTVISKFSIKHLKETAAYVDELEVDSYINEVAEQRSELFTEDSDITPSPKEYQKAIRFFSKQIRKNFSKYKLLDRIVMSFRLVYYDLAVKIMSEKRQVIPCYSAIANAQISPYGDVWPCCILGYSKPLGNLRDFDYDFRKLWRGKKAKSVRKYIKGKNCACPLANIALTNIMMSPKYMMKVLHTFLFTKG